LLTYVIAPKAKRHIVETGLVIGGHYLLQRLIKQGPYSTVYQGVDQLFQRMVAVKAVSAAHIPAYRAAVRLTSQFSYPHIIVLYDLVIKADKLYIIQEYVEGDDFATLLQTPLQPYEIVVMGQQICSALIYASTSSRKVCHGDLTPSAIFRDRSGHIRVNNFALPSDLTYFATWSVIGGDEGELLADKDLPWGVISPGRQADDTRAIGLLLYQLLTNHAPGATVVEPPPDGRLRFPRTVPAELCDVVARSIIRGHPQHIPTVEVLYKELKALTEVLQPAVPVLVSSQARPLQPTEAVRPMPSPDPGMVGNLLPGEHPAGTAFAYRNDNNSHMAAMAADELHTSLTATETAVPMRPFSEPHPMPVAYDPPEKRQSSSLLWLLLIGLIIFALFFVVGFFAGHLFIAH
jgi:serine/threonine protein kinase